MLTAETLRELLDYDAETGVFTWRVSRPKAKAGARAGCTRHDGYLLIRIHGKLYLGHRLAWLHVKGEWPAGRLDHRDLDKSNCRIDNLRPATQSQNLMNIRAHRDNTSGFKGVGYEKRTGRWFATICRDYKSTHLGTFDTPEEAHAAYVEASQRLHKDFSRTN